MKKSEIRELLLSKEIIPNSLTGKEYYELVKIIRNKKQLNYFEVISLITTTVRDAHKVKEGLICGTTIRDIILRDILKLDVEAILIEYTIDRVKTIKSNTNGYNALLNYLLGDYDHRYVLLNLLPVDFLSAMYDASLGTVVDVMENYLDVGMYTTQAEVNEELLAQFNSVIDKMKAKETKAKEKEKKTIEMSFDAETKDIKLVLPSESGVNTITVVVDEDQYVLDLVEDSKVQPFESSLDEMMSGLSK